ncbi:cytochrome b-c1 complex subunit 8 [Alligator mississippiensis]|uniref:Cytochrome b-c1 complex subunit 8 n=1 Tax=Alligator mississippiensis TaxID=8496 RepID=A0A151M6T4_ALLMI|nr:cytochrome b-c1 complex subunit 8 [Alligator mississippiensis]KYO20243.1 cytochrome b-c1 complex subunit 8 [Alligator mississippiensis]
MGPEFGRLAYVRHIITYSLSPFEQRPFAKYFSVGLPNLWRRFRGQVLRVGPLFMAGYALYLWAIEEEQRLKRKNPADYVNDE